MKWAKRLLGINRLEDEIRITNEKLLATTLELEQAKKQNEQALLDPKAAATASNEPYVEIVTIDLNPDNPSLGSFELDWNEQFIKKLRAMGYPGPTDEVVIDLWFQDVCRNILLETYEQEQANRSMGSDNIRYINRKDLGGGKTEVS